MALVSDGEESSDEDSDSGSEGDHIEEDEGDDTLDAETGDVSRGKLQINDEKSNITGHSKTASDVDTRCGAIGDVLSEEGEVTDGTPPPLLVPAVAPKPLTSLPAPKLSDVASLGALAAVLKTLRVLSDPGKLSVVNADSLLVNCIIVRLETIRNNIVDKLVEWIERKISHV